MNTAEASRRLPGSPVQSCGPRKALTMVAALAAAAVLATGCAGPVSEQAPAPATPVPDTAELGRKDLDTWLDGVVPGALETSGIPGATISVVKDGRLVTARGYGHADTGTDGGDPVPVDPEKSLFRVGSVSKLATATAVMQLVEDGEVDLDTDVNEYLDFTLPTSYDEPVTLRHLLTHTPGFEERVGGLILPEDAEADLREYLVSDTPAQVYEPGTVPAYSNYGNALAGYIVERVSGAPFEEYVERNVFEPAGMDSSFAQPLSEDRAARVAKGYGSDAEEAAPFEVVGGAPAGSMSASATDMARFMLAHLDALDADQAPLDTKTLELMQKPALGEDSLGGLANGPRMTQGFFEEDRNGHRAIGHGGDTNYFHSHLRLYPDEDTGIFLSLNGNGYGGTEAYLLREEILAGFGDRYFPESGKEKSSVEPTAAEHAAMAEGTYESSRSMESTFLNAVGVLGGQTRIAAREDGTIEVTPGPEDMQGNPTVYEEVEPWVWREVGGQRILSMRVEDGQVEAVGFAAAFTLLPVGPEREAAIALPVVVSAIVVLLAAVLSWPIGAVARRRLSLPPRAKSGRTARILTRLGVVSALAALTGWAAAVTLVMGFSEVPEEVLYALAGAQWLGVVSIAPAAVVLFDDIRRRAGWARCLGSTLVLLALVAVAAFAAVFGLLSLDVGY